jgi:hypothetical protein
LTARAEQNANFVSVEQVSAVAEAAGLSPAEITAESRRWREAG